MTAKTFVLWLQAWGEGGSDAKARCLGEWEGESFREAVDQWRKTIPKESWEVATQDYDAHKDVLGQPAYWSLRIYDNETDASILSTGYALL